MTKVKVISKYLTLKQLLPSKMGKISLIQLSDEEINTDEVAQKNDLKSISNCHYHKFMFELSKKQSKVRFIVYNRCIVKIAKNRSWNNALTMAFCINTASIPIKFFKVTYSGIFRRYEKI